MKKGSKHSLESIRKMRESSKGQIAWNKGKKCPQWSGAKHGMWKGGKAKDSDGYIMILKPNHLRADKRGYVKEHILVMEAHLGRYLTPAEEIHHLDHNKQNNKIENLHLFPNKGEHSKYHWELIKIVKGLVKNKMKIGCVNL